MKEGRKECEGQQEGKKARRKASKVDPMDGRAKKVATLIGQGRKEGRKEGRNEEERRNVKEGKKEGK